VALAISQPEIFNTDQGVQFTSKDFTGKLQSCGIQISMDGRGRVFDNIFIERLWRSVKYEEVYVKNYESVSDAAEGLTRYFQLYNRERLHESLGQKTPHEVYFGNNRKFNNDGDACRLIHQIQPIFLS
jgi:putative transposase